jgi:thymidylate synthase (FAD)
LIQVIDYTRKPLTLIGTCAKECWGSNPKNLVKVAEECIASQHGRVLEFPDVTIVIDGYSARAIRELYTHVIGTTRLQSSTRYINYNNLEYFIPPSIDDERKLREYNDVMSTIKEGYYELEQLGVPKEDIANILPLGMESRIVLKINARAILHLAEMRLCARAYHEIRKMLKEILETIKALDEEWAIIIGLAKPRCEVHGYCPEKFSCGKVKTMAEIKNREETIEMILSAIETSKEVNHGNLSDAQEILLEVLNSLK